MGVHDLGDEKRRHMLSNKLGLSKNVILNSVKSILF